MDCASLHERLAAEMNSVFDCQLLEDGLLSVQTPFSYPNGDHMEVFVRERDDKVIVTDFGETLRYLSSMNVSVDAGKRKQQFEAFLSQGIVENRDGLLVREASSKDFVLSLYRLCETMVRISDITISSRARTTEDFKNLIRAATYNLVDPDAVEEDVSIIGLSGAEWEIDLRIVRAGFDAVAEANRYVLTLAARDAQSAGSALEEAVTIWDDLDEIDAGSRLSVLDDREKVWKPSSLRQLERHSAIVVWQSEDSIAEYRRALFA